MRIYITESERHPKEWPQWSVTLDTKTDDENTQDAVALALRAVVAYGHHPRNVYEAAIVESNESLHGLKDKDE
jgi:hypothetical protein